MGLGADHSLQLVTFIAVVMGLSGAVWQVNVFVGLAYVILPSVGYIMQTVGSLESGSRLQLSVRLSSAANTSEQS